MKPIVFISLLVLAACSRGSSLPSNPDSVPNIQLSLTQTRATQGAIYVRGGIYDGGAAGQTATFVVTPDDSVICTFQTDPVGGGALAQSRMDAYRLTTPGAYRAVAGAVLPNVSPENTTFTTNFTIEAQGQAGLSRTVTGFGDPRFDALTAYFLSNPTPCWNFG